MASSSSDPTQLLDDTTPFDEEKVRLLEQVLLVMLNGSKGDREIANQVLSQLKAKPEAWRIAGLVLNGSRDPNARFFSLQILEQCIDTRWNIIPEEQREGMKRFVADLAVKSATDSTTEKFLLTKINETLIKVVTREWPERWPSFIPDLCNAAKTNQNICENNMRILNLLSEEVFDFGNSHLTSRRVESLMQTMADQFQQIFDLCMFIIENHLTHPNTVHSTLLETTLHCLQHFLRWIPYGYIFQTGLIDILLDHFWDTPKLRRDTVRCLVEIAGLKDVGPEGNLKLRAMWSKLLTKLEKSPTLEYETTTSGASRVFWECYHAQLALLITTFLKHHRTDVAEASGDPRLYTGALSYLVQMSSLPHEDTFKIALDYWHGLSEELVNEVRGAHQTALGATGRAVTGGVSEVSAGTGGVPKDDTYDIESSPAPLEHPELYSERLNTYQPILNQVREILTKRMAKPREVLIAVDDDTGAVEREFTPDTDEIALYNTMREAHIFLANLGPTETEMVLGKLVEEEMTVASDKTKPDQWNPQAINRLCWSIGSISGALPEENEKRFLISVIRSLLTLCESKKGKENKAIVASQIMYVNGQYPRFLKAHWGFLKTLVRKIFEFMKETFPGVQEMACNTLLKISQKCRSKLACKMEDDDEPFIVEMIHKLSDHLAGLETQRQRILVFESISHVIAAAEESTRCHYISFLMQSVNQQWKDVIYTANQNPNMLLTLEVAKKVSDVLQVNERVAYGAGSCFAEQFMAIYPDMLKVYAAYSKRISLEVQHKGASIMTHLEVKQLRLCKRGVLSLVDTFVSRAVSGEVSDDGQRQAGVGQAGQTWGGTGMISVEEDLIQKQIMTSVVPPLLEPVLEDYRSNCPQARDHEVLLLLTSLIDRLGPNFEGHLPRVFEFVFDCTLDMIKADFHSFPDHRNRFYDLLHTCNSKCFRGLLALPEPRLADYVKSLVWAFKHEHPQVAERGLSITNEFLSKLISASPSPVLLSFCQSYYYILLDEIFSVLTDTLHRSGFKSQTMILTQLIQIIEFKTVECPSQGLMKNQVMEHIAKLLLNNFATLKPKQVEVFVLDLFNLAAIDFKKFYNHVLDFLVQIKEFAGDDQLFEHERQQAIQRTRDVEEKRRQIPGYRPQ
eukprot:GHVN01051325.1.p1 GENE.GHVN01051325.1~~GHVN01051325.1.p1  ORF type:complete len:1134 (-),score=196.33 GHVN01051325.1:166-3567(-)